MITNILLPTTFPYVFLRNQTGATKQFNNSAQISFSNHGIIPLVQSVHMKNRLRFPCFNRFSPTIKKNNNKPHRSRQIQLNLCLLRKREKKIQENSKSNSGSIFPYEIENSSSVRRITRVKVSFYLGDVLVKDVFDGVVI